MIRKLTNFLNKKWQKDAMFNDKTIHYEQQIFRETVSFLT